MIKIENKGGKGVKRWAAAKSHKSSVTPRRREVCSRPPLMSRLGRERRVRRTERVYFITTRFYRGDPAGSSLFALPCL